jgi:hypothetical protein
MMLPLTSSMLSELATHNVTAQVTKDYLLLSFLSEFQRLAMVGNELQHNLFDDFFVE